MNEIIFSRLFRFVFFIVINFLIAPTIYAEEAPFTLVPEMQERILQLLKNYKPQLPITKVISVYELSNPGNFGKLEYLDAQSTRALQENGLWAISGIGTPRNGRGGLVGRSLSLCGLITALNASTSTTVNTIPPLMFVPFGIRSRTDIVRRVRLKSIETTAVDICSPAPGTEFSYRIESEVQTKSSGIFGREKSINETAAWNCKVAQESQPASEISPAFKGQALMVTCETQIAASSKPMAEYIFLQDSGYYLQIRTKSGSGGQKIEYKEIEYGS